MTLDISGKTFDPRDNHNDLLIAQGKLTLDSEQNEAASARDRRWRTETMDLIGRAGYPALLPDSFRITLGGGGLLIDPGRYYVDGFQPENHGLSAAQGGVESFDAAHEELRSTTPVPFDQQPYLPGAVQPDPADGPVLVYLDVWRREVDHLKDPSLVETAVGVNTAGRTQTVWQVRGLSVGAGVTCDTEDALIDQWLEEIAPSTLRLSSFLVPISDPDNPCEIAPAQRLRTTENRTYRVATHGLAPDGRPLLKWSRTNASVGTRVLSIDSATQITVAQAIRDDVHRFTPGDWIEFVDDRLEFAGEPGLMRMVDMVDPATNVITFQNPLPGGIFPVDGDGVPNPDRNLRIIRWDQRGEVRASGGTILGDLTDPLGVGAFPAPAAGEFVELEAGIAVEAGFLPGPQKARVDDHWIFRARAVTGTIEELTQAPPAGTHHHYARLAVVQAGPAEFVEPLEDCRDPIDTGEDCCCTFVVAPGGDIQQAIDQLPAAGGCICLKPGEHAPQQTLLISRSNVTLHGEAKGVTIRAPGGSPALRMTGTLSDPAARNRVHTIRFIGNDAPANAGGLLDLTGAEDVEIADCDFTATPEEVGIAIRIAASNDIAVCNVRIDSAVTGILATARSGDIVVRDCRMALGSLGDTPGLVGVGMDQAAGAIEVSATTIGGAVAGIVVNDNPGGIPFSLATGSRVLDCAIDLAPLPAGGPPGIAIGIDMAAVGAELRGNAVTYTGAGQIGIRIAGAYGRAAQNRCRYSADAVSPQTIGIVLGSTEADIDLPSFVDDIEVSGNSVEGPQSGIVALNTRDCRLFANRVAIGGRSFGGFGILAMDCTGLDVTNNAVSDAAVGVGIAQGGRCRIEGNRIERGGFGIVVLGQDSPTVSANRLRQARLGGILCALTTARTVILENRLIACGSDAALGLGIACFAVLGETAVCDNEVMDTGQGPDGSGSTTAIGILGDLVLEALIRGNLVTYSGGAFRDVANEDRALRYRGFLEMAFVQSNRETVLGFPIKILGNSFIGTGATALVEILSQPLTDTIAIRFERVTFSDNYCMHVSLDASDGRGTVALRGRRGAVIGNQVKSFVGDYFPFHMHEMSVTYAGNVTEQAPLFATVIPVPTNDYNLES